MLRAVGVSLALPALECMLPVLRSEQAQDDVPRRMAALNTELSFYQPNLMPTKPGRDYETPLYLKPLADLRDDMTLISGTSHPEVDGMHAAYKSWLTAAPHPGAANFKNTISMDQLAAKSIGSRTRFASLILGGRISYSANGVALPGNPSPASNFAKLFLEGRPTEKARQLDRLSEGRSILDTVADSAKRMRTRVSPQDRTKLDEYFDSVREAERQLHKSQQWHTKPKPKVDAKQPRDITDRNSIIARQRQRYDIMYLALLTDSTRIITQSIGDSNSVATLPGVSMSYHNLSHHGQDPQKLKQLAIVEGAHVKAFGDFLRRLKQTKEADSNLLDRTTVLLGSHMHDGRHDNRNLPIVVAGGGFRHGQHLAFDRTNNYPLANLYVSMLHQLGVEVDRFASSTGTMKGLEVR